MTSLRTHESTFEVAKKNLSIDPEAFQKAQDKYSKALRLHGHNIKAATVKATPDPGEMPTSGGGDAPPSRLGPPCPERELSSSDTTSHTEKEGDPTKPSQWRFTPLSQREVPVAPGVIKFMTKKPGDDRTTDTTKGGEAPLTMRVTHKQHFPFPSAMRQG